MTTGHCECGHDSERHDDQGVCFGRVFLDGNGRPNFEGDESQCRCKRYKEKLVKIGNAAILEKGRVWVGHRHHLIMEAIIRELGMSAAPILGEQGFVTDQGKFVDRGTAATIAFEAGQLKASKKTLFSEDLFSPDGAALWH